MGKIYNLILKIFNKNKLEFFDNNLKLFGKIKNTYVVISTSKISKNQWTIQLISCDNEVSAKNRDFEEFSYVDHVSFFLREPNRIELLTTANKLIKNNLEKL